MSAMQEEVRPVIVVGAGPVGLTAALALARFGARVLVLETQAGLAYTSRAICISRRSLELFDRLGVGAAFARIGLPWTEGRSYYRDREVFHLRMAHGAGDKHTPFINIQQAYTEKLLLDAAQANPNIEIRWRCPVERIAIAADGVSAEAAGAVYRGSYLVAADGARSMVRAALGLRMQGTSYQAQYLIADIELRSDHPVERRVWFDPPSNPGSTLIMHRQPDNVWRIDYQLRDGEDAEAAMLVDNIVPRIQSHLDMIGEKGKWRLIWHSLYRAHCLTLDSYRHGRVLLAGDAAHLVPIFGVRGLNSGIDDAVNLGWKLAMVLRGQAGEALLDSYSVERVGATRENIANAEKSTWFMSPPTPGFAFMRDVVLGLAVYHPFVRGLINPRQSSAHLYAGSPLNTPASGPGLAPGAPVPNLPVETDGGVGDFLYDLLADDFTLLSLSDHGPAKEAAAVAAKAGWPVAHLGLRGAPALERALGEDALLIRPDGHLAARFHVLTDQALRLALARALARDIQVETGHAEQ